MILPDDRQISSLLITWRRQPAAEVPKHRCAKKLFFRADSSWLACSGATVIKFYFRFSEKCGSIPRVPCPQEGRIAIVTDVGCGMRWTRWLRETNTADADERNRVVLIPRRCRAIAYERNPHGIDSSAKGGLSERVRHSRSDSDLFSIRFHRPVHVALVHPTASIGRDCVIAICDSPARRWDQVCRLAMSALRARHAVIGKRRWLKSPDTGESAYKPYTIAQGCGCGWHPAFPAPSIFEGHASRITRASRAAGTRWRVVARNT